MNVFRSGLSLFLLSVALFAAVDSPAWGHSELVVASQRELQRFDAVTGVKLAGYLLPFGDRSVDVAVGPDNALYTTGLAGTMVYRVNPADGALAELEPFAAPGVIDRPTGLTFGPDGALYVASSDSKQVLRFNGQTGDFIDVFADLFSAPGDGRPEDVLFGPDGDLYVTTIDGTRVLRFDGQSGAYDGVFAEEGGLLESRQMAFGPNGGLFVASRGNSRIVIYDDHSGEFLGTLQLVPRANGLAFGPDGLLYASSESSELIMRFNVQTESLHDIFIGPSSDLSHPKGMAFYTPIPEPSSAALAVMVIVSIAVALRTDVKRLGTCARRKSFGR